MDKPSNEKIGTAVLKAMIAAREAAAAKAAEIAPVVESDTKTVTFKAIACDEFGIITGIGGAAGSVSKLDHDQEFLEKNDLCKLAFGFCGSANRTFKANHDDDHLIDAELVQSWVGAPIIATPSGTRTLEAHESLTKDMEVIGIDTRRGNESYWFVSVKPQDSAIIEGLRRMG